MRKLTVFCLWTIAAATLFLTGNPACRAAGLPRGQDVIEAPAIGDLSVQMTVASAQQHGAARGAQRVGDERILEPHPFRGDTVEVGGFVDPASIAADGLRRMVVAHYKNDIRGGICHNYSLNMYIILNP